MQITDLIPWNKNKQPATRKSEVGDYPLVGLQRDLNRVFEDFWGRFDRPYLRPFDGLGHFGPSIDVTETDNAVDISVELPGLDEKDIDVTLTDDVLTIRGEKKNAHEEKKKGYYLAERSFGSFYRSIPLPAGIDTEKADARFKRGVLSISLPKTPEARARTKKIEVKAA